jgi:hypothetical protein
VTESVFGRHGYRSADVPALRRRQITSGFDSQGEAMKMTVVGDHEDFAAASRAAAELMIAGFTQSQISIVGRDVVAPEGAASRFAFAGAVASALAGATEDDFGDRLVAALSHLCVPPRAAMRHAGKMSDSGGLVIVQADVDRARQAETVMRRHGVATSYAAGSVPLAATPRAAVQPTALAA